MHHRNHKNSSANHNSPQHIKNIPTNPSPGGASTSRKSNFLKTLAGKFKEKPATREEVEQLRLNTVREELKTRKQVAKNKRPSRFGFMNSQPQPSYRSSSRHHEEPSFLFGNEKSSGSFLDFSSGPSLDMFKGNSEGSRRKKNQKSGLEEMF